MKYIVKAEVDLMLECEIEADSLEEAQALATRLTQQDFEPCFEGNFHIFDIEEARE